MSDVVADRNQYWVRRALPLEPSFQDVRTVYLVAAEGEEVLAFMRGRWISRSWSELHVGPDEDFHVDMFAVVSGHSGKDLVRLFVESAGEFFTGPVTIGFNVPEGSPLFDVLVTLGCEITPTGTFYETGARRLQGRWHCGS
ncbi:hypothetical protein [Actinomadura luteofluorescens]|uniref:hypothetical protein n=1 Tax=Actinomadura luteofluorescens TaxID=46163 RepID=UPI00216466A9|nr:hypothetical protein [Actinomadura glauciflava]